MSTKSGSAWFGPLFLFLIFFELLPDLPFEVFWGLVPGGGEKLLLNGGEELLFDKEVGFTAFTS